MNSVFLNFACNDERGNLSGYVEQINIRIDDVTEMELEGPFTFDGPKHCVLFDRQIKKAGVTLLFIGTYDRSFPVTRYTEWVGNLCWNGAYTTPEVAADLLNHLHSMNKWTVQVAPLELSTKWQQGVPFVAADFGGEEVETPLRCPSTLPMFPEVEA